MIPPLPSIFAELSIFDQVAIIFINAVGLSLFLTVWAHTKLTQKRDRVLITMGLFMFLWVDFAYLARLLGEPNIYWAEIALRIAWVATPIFFTYVYLITVYIIGQETKYKILNKFIITEGILMSVITATTNYVVAGIKFTGTNLDIQYGAGFMPFLALVAINIFATIIPFVSFLRTRTKSKKTDGIRYYIVGLSIFYFFNGIFNIALPVFKGISNLYFLGDYSLIFFVSFTSFAIFRGKLFNIGVIKTDFLVTILWASILIRIFLIGQNTSLIISSLVNLTLVSIVMILSVSFIRSVTEEVKQKEQLAIANKQLEKLNLEKSEFLSLASHQLKHSPTIVRNYASLIMEGSYGEIPQKVKEKIGNMVETAQEQLVIIDDFLNISRIEQGRMKYDFGPVPMDKLVNELSEEFKEIAVQTKTELTHEIKGAGPFTIRADYGKIKQVVTNLINNAVEKYAKGKTVRVTLESLGEGKGIRLLVSDTGLGMSKETIARLFKRFSRAKDIGEKAESREGSGLGLYIAREMVLAHGGRVWAESAGEGKGSVFFLELPSVPVENNTNTFQKEGQETIPAV